MLARSWRTLEALCGCGADEIRELTLVSLPHTDSVEDDFELSTVCHRPESMDKLQEQTKFTKKELQVLYRGFKNVGLAEVIREKKNLARVASLWELRAESVWQELKLTCRPLYILC